MHEKTGWTQWRQQLANQQPGPRLEWQLAPAWGYCTPPCNKQQERTQCVQILIINHQQLLWGVIWLLARTKGKMRNSQRQLHLEEKKSLCPPL